MHLLNINLDGYKVKDLQNFVNQVDKCLNALRRRDRPAKSTMFEFLFCRLKGVQRLHRTIERIKDSPTRSHRRTFSYLYRKLNESLRDSREDENNMAVQRNLTQHTRAAGAPALNTSEKPPKGDGKKDRNTRGRDRSKSRQGGRDQSTRREQDPKPRNDSKGKGKGKGNKGDGKGADPKAKAKAKADAKANAKSKIKREASKGPLTDEQKANITCRFWKQGKCTDSNCKFSHTDKVPAGAAVVVPATPARA